MTDRRALAAIASLLIGACSRPAPDAGSNAQVSSARVTTAAAAPAAPAAKPSGCSDKIQVALDRPSLIDAGDKPFAAARLAAFEARAAAAFHRAANDDCKTAAVRKSLAAIHEVIVQSGAGATESTFYHEEGRRPDDLVFQWAFNEADLGIPKQADIELGLRCWADGARAECADKGD
jgi:hypothetical protein